jgi:hypothetical protein
MGSLVQASDGNLYGVTLYGEIYQSTLAGSFEIIVPASFDPIRSGLTQASDGNLWATHQGASNTDPGDIFAVTLAGQQVQDVRFSCTLNGGMPQGVIQATDGKLYGVGTSCVDSSGVQHFGTVFVVDARRERAASSAPYLTIHLMTPIDPVRQRPASTPDWQAKIDVRFHRPTTMSS